MAKRPLKELFNLNKVEEVSVCTKNNPPANGFKQFEIMKNSFNKSEFEDLFEELSLPEYGDFVGYLNLFLEDDVNQVAYYAFLDALFLSLKEVCFDGSLTKEEKALRMKDNFDNFIEEYKSSVITKTEDGKVFLNMNKNENKQEIVDIKKCYGECYPCCGENKTFSEIIEECAPSNINNSLWSLFIYKLDDKLWDIHYMDEKEYTKEQKSKMIVDLFAEFVKNFNETELIKSQKNIEKQEFKMDLKSLVEGIKSLITKAEESSEVEAIAEEVVEEVKPETETIPAEEVSEEAKVEEIVEPEQEPELAETPAEEVLTEEPKVEKSEEEIPATEEAPVVEEAKVEGDEEPKEEPVQKSEEPSIEEILKAKEDEVQALKTQIEKAEEAQKESEIKLEKAELLKSIESEYSGLVGTSEEILEKVYEINKSELSPETKEFALEGLKKLSAKNLEKTQEIGVEVKDEMTELPLEEKINKRAKEIQKSSKEKLTNLQAWSQAKKELTN